MQNIKPNNKDAVQLPNSPSNYDPLLDKDYMSPNMVQFFKNKLKEIHKAIIIKENITSHSIIEHPNNDLELLDQVAFEERTFYEFMLQEHEASSS